MKYILADNVVDIDVKDRELSNDMSAYVYQGTAPARFAFGATREEIEKESEAFLSDFSALIEESVIKKKFYAWLTRQNGTLLHACAVEMEGAGYAFTGCSGSGKSTHCSLWKQTFGRDRVRVLNDDKPFLFRENGVFYICGSPWCGKIAENINAKARLAGICVLRQSANNEIHRIERDRAVLELYKQTYAPDSEEGANKVFGFFEDLADSVPVFELSCNISEDAAKLAYNTMRPEVKRNDG